ncbi:hypothetical protein C9374_002429 [Naegleria lovaniensis]|uniref:Anoctamin transmembrane domain-containing protein n=1 Tax=Naegleria lovaniensis TaxID=51637 RepID=A0AA88GTN7_NAELO|nr:uncharacterized protein C9374_002429 [Naegleria lovaniensis]KAG2386685.1 hypothetical protein C9374_002429 [Naegleria lovaniensis]
MGKQKRRQVVPVVDETSSSATTSSNVPTSTISTQDQHPSMTTYPLAYYFDHHRNNHNNNINVYYNTNHSNGGNLNTTATTTAASSSSPQRTSHPILTNNDRGRSSSMDHPISITVGSRDEASVAQQQKTMNDREGMAVVPQTNINQTNVNVNLYVQPTIAALPHIPTEEKNLEELKQRNREMYGNQYQLWRAYKEKNSRPTTSTYDLKNHSLTRKLTSKLHSNQPPPPSIHDWSQQGYKLQITAKGHPFLVKDTYDKSKQQVKEKKIRVWARWSAMEDAYGLGVKLYFDFARIMIVLNALLFFIQFLNIAAHIAVDLQDIRNSLALDLSIFDQLYSSSYSKNLYWVWISTNALCIFISLAIGPIYWWIVHTYYEKRDLYDCEENILDEESNKIKENQKTKLIDHIARMILSYFVFFIFMMVAFVVTMGFTILQNVNAMYQLADSTFSENTNILTAISIAISVVISVMSFIWKKICVYLTNFERHKTWSAYRKHNTFKFLFFKLFSVFVMGFTKGFFATPCVIKIMGNQYMIQMVTDFCLSVSVEFLLPWIIYKVKGSLTKNKETIIHKPEFDVSEEYLELIYRQYIIYNGFVSFPLITLIGFVASLFELYMDKFRLIKLSSKPPLTTGSVKSVVAGFLILASVLAIINWGGGNLYILSGFYWCNTPSDIECAPCVLTSTGKIPNLIKLMFESY